MDRVNSTNLGSRPNLASASRSMVWFGVKYERPARSWAAQSGRPSANAAIMPAAGDRPDPARQ